MRDHHLISGRDNEHEKELGTLLGLEPFPNSLRAGRNFTHTRANNADG
jgi:hypothetical protein